MIGVPEKVVLDTNVRDPNFPYEHVMISENYHLIYKEKPQRNHMDFNPAPAHKRGYGSVGLNHVNKVNDTDHQIVIVETYNDSTATSYKFGAVEKVDMPFSKNSQNVL